MMTIHEHQRHESMSGGAPPARYPSGNPGIRAKIFCFSKILTNFRPQLREKEGEVKQLTSIST
jgi:hypothetical protein